MQAFGPKLATACGPIGPSAGLNPGPCRVSSRIQAVEASRWHFLVFSFLFLHFFGFLFFLFLLKTKYLQFFSDFFLLLGHKNYKLSVSAISFKF